MRFTLTHRTAYTYAGPVHESFNEVRPDFVIHTAAQPSHDKAASIPYDDFDVNAVGTLNPCTGEMM